MGYTSDFMPHVGELSGSPGQYVIAGFSGHGMPQILAASQGLAKIMTGAAPTFEQSGLPLMFETTAERLAIEKSELEESFKDAWELEDRKLDVNQ